MKNPLDITLYCLFDKSRGWYINPVPVPTESEAIRFFKQLMETKETYVYHRYDDFDLCVLCVYSMDTGVIRKGVRTVIKGSSIKPKVK